jgi:hypothetical protein
MRTFLAVAAVLLTLSPIAAQEAEVRKVLERYLDVRPTAEELAIYRLDWADSLEIALERARQEKRPVLLVRIYAQYGDLFSGHC